MMPTTRSKSVRADDAATFEEPEISATSGSGEVRELRSQLATLTDLAAQQAATALQLADTARRQEVRMQRLEDLLLQQAAAGEAQVSVLPAPVETVAPGKSSPLLDTSQTTIAVAPRRGVGSTTNSGACGSGDFPFDGRRAEWQRLMDRLNEFRRVWLATHHLDGEAYSWWVGIQDNPNTDVAAISWKRFKELLLEHYFLARVKRKLEQDLREMRQGDQTLAEYEREFSWLQTLCALCCAG
uniref:Retrotransposon gag domain-containing protein n=1 Tax=Ananas comosus var. bracteatus TaxID=296719 RepID=A0A6V7PH26_ANACO|nr:unnamed protein product [Ananas comosus var. bracteatus]